MASNYKKLSFMKKYNGFTLIELMIVIIIIGIMASVVMPTFRTYISNTASNSLSNTLLIDIMHARNHAITNETIVKMIPTGSSDRNASLFVPNAAGVNWGQGWIIFEDLNDNDIRDVDELIIRNHVSFGAEAHISSGPAGQLLDANRPIGFDATGISYGAGVNTGRGILTIATFGCAGLNARSIQITQIGQIIGTDLPCPNAFSGL